MTSPALTTPGLVALCTGAVLAVGNWWAVSVGHRRVEWVTKPAVMVALIVAAVVLDPVDPTVRVAVVVGLVCSLAGDVFLMLPRERFIEGLASFLVAHVAYVVGFLIVAVSRWGAAVGVVAALVALAVVGRPIVAAVRRDHPTLVGPVAGYMGVISTMVVAAAATAQPWMIAGAVLFFASDGVLATNRFARHIPGARFTIMSTYHAAQFAFVVALAR